MIEKWMLIRLIQALTQQYRLRFGMGYIYLDISNPDKFIVLKDSTGYPRILDRVEIAELHDNLQFSAVVGYQSDNYVVLVHTPHFSNERVESMIKVLAQLDSNCGREILA